METGQVMWFADHVLCRPRGVNHMVLSVLFFNDDKKDADDPGDISYCSPWEIIDAPKTMKWATEFFQNCS